MKPKEYLQQSRKIDHQIKALNAERESLYEAGQLQSPAFTDRVQTSLEPDKIGRIAVKIADRDEEIEEQIDKLVDFRITIARQIRALSKPEYVDVLTFRYINCMPWYKIADRMGYDEVYVRGRLHGDALEAFRRMWEKEMRKV